MAAFCRFLLALFITLFTLSSNALPTISSNEQVCASCHATEVKEWQKSHHFHAMEVASKQSILGDFNNSSLNYQNTRVLFITKGNAFHIEMPDEDGKLKLYKVSHTFGYHPLQQYMFDYGNGRY